MENNLNRWIHENIFGLKCGEQFWVVNKDGSVDVTVPFKAQSRDHAEKWLKQGVEPYYLDHEIEIRPDCPNYSGDIAEAWKVIEKMREQGFGYECYRRVLDAQHTAVFSKDEITRFYIFAENLPEAICLAAKLAIEHQKEWKNV
ncbi:MAG: hypothetical protein JSS81_07310 [Acidobacteria bacterium]|nr:hypothetical protein [Acidobacteriota bacterium]